MKKIDQYMLIILAITSTIIIGVTLLIIFPILVLWEKLNKYKGEYSVTGVQSESLTYYDLAIYD